MTALVRYYINGKIMREIEVWCYVEETNNSIIKRVKRILRENYHISLDMIEGLKVIERNRV